MEKELRYIWIPAKAFRARKPEASICALILHSTDGRKAGDIATLTGNKVSVHWYVTRSGELYHFVQDSDCAFHTGAVTNKRYGNDYTIGIEQEHFDGKEDWPDVQVQKVAELVAFERQKYGPIPILSHAAVAYPKGRKVDPVNYPWDKLSAYFNEAKNATWKAVRV